MSVLRLKPKKLVATGFEAKSKETITTGFEANPEETAPVVLRLNH
jgi:hypothetical protein